MLPITVTGLERKQVYSHITATELSHEQIPFSSGHKNTDFRYLVLKIQVPRQSIHHNRFVQYSAPNGTCLVYQTHFIKPIAISNHHTALGCSSLLLMLPQ